MTFGISIWEQGIVGQKNSAVSPNHHPPATTLTDEQLALGLQAGERQDLAALVERHHSPLVGYLPLAEDLAQESFLRVLKGINHYHYPRPFKPWLYAILLETTPLTLPVYLIGKVLGFWLSGLSGLVGVILISMAAWRVILGPFAVTPVLTMWLVGGGSIIVINGGLGVILAAGQPNRRWAALVGIILAFVSIVMFSSSVGANTVDFFYLNNLARPALQDYFMLSSLQRAISGNIISITEYKDVWLTIAAGLGQLLLAGVIMWRWLVHRNGR